MLCCGFESHAKHFEVWTAVFGSHRLPGNGSFLVLCYFSLQTFAYDPKIPSERENMADDSVKWASVFFVLGVGSGIGIFFQVSFIIEVIWR